VMVAPTCFHSTSASFSVELDEDNGAHVDSAALTTIRNNGQNSRVIYNTEKETYCENEWWIEMDRDRVQWRSLLLVALNLQVMILESYYKKETSTCSFIRV
jgi:hypothetical protein